MAEIRSHIHEESFEAAPEQMFELLITPSAIRGWWGAASAIVLPKEGGFWAAAWGDDEDAPDYLCEFTIKEFEPPRRMLLADGKYFAKSGQPAFELDLTTEFVIEGRMTGCLLRVVQDGFPVHEIADDFYKACEVGWTNTFAGIRQYLQFGHPNSPKEEPETDSHLTPDQEFRVSSLTAEQLAEIDRAILANASDRLRKVARVVGGAIGDLKPRFIGIPDIFFSRRVRKLVGEGKLEAYGNLSYMRFSEIRLPSIRIKTN